jgi:ATP-dependent 26S proteasome regulatory subunit
VISLEVPDQFRGYVQGIRVHKLEPVARGQIILPQCTFDLLERNVVGFAALRPKLATLGMSLKKGLLFYGPPGTGKTYTIRFLAGLMPDHTTLLIAAEQVVYFDKYLQLARFLQPAIVAIEDVDLIARERTHMRDPCEESLLNKLLNEMDGLREDAQLIFLLTTNRPEELERALVSRPGRIDQAIEFPLPDEDSRRKLVHLYGGSLPWTPDLVDTVVARTDKASPAFIKELIRRAAQSLLARGRQDELTCEDIRSAFEEMVFTGGSLNLKLFGAGPEAAS